MGSIDIDEIDCDTRYKIQKQTLIDEIDDAEFPEIAIENLSKIMDCVAPGNLNIWREMVWSRAISIIQMVDQHPQD